MTENYKENDRPKGYFENDRAEMLEYVPGGVKTCLEFGCGTSGFSGILKDQFSTENWAVELDTASAGKAAQKLDKVLNKDVLDMLGRLVVYCLATVSFNTTRRKKSSAKIKNGFVLLTCYSWTILFRM